ncbi:MAG: c-type cytochrome [Methylobacteriaceae bacterium]|nr:c-type cytochrome [Methylobacteriaceae bacterium]
MPSRAKIGAAAAILALFGAGALLIASEHPADYRGTVFAAGGPADAQTLMIRFGCATCHDIRGVAAPGAHVGPPLEGIRERVYLAGVLENTPSNLVRWIVDPRGINPKTAMPITGISEAQARDVAAYLYGLQ